MQEVLVEEEPLSGYCKPFKTDDITVDSCKIRKETATTTKDITLRRCRSCEGLFVSKNCISRLVVFEGQQFSKPVRDGYCTECGKHKSEVKKFHGKVNKCSACYQTLWRAGAL